MAVSQLLLLCRFRSLVNEYLAETETAMTKAETGEFLFDDLRELAENHAQQKVEFEKLIPENISLGLFVVGRQYSLEKCRDSDDVRILSCLDIFSADGRSMRMLSCD